MKPISKNIGAPNSVARYLSDNEGKFGQNKFLVLQRIHGELIMIAGQTTIEGARRYMLPGRQLVDVENCHIIEEMELIGQLIVKSICRDLDCTVKAMLFTQPTHNEFMAAEFGPETWCVWDSAEPESITRYLDEERARKGYRAAMVHGTNGFSAVV